MKPAPLEYLAAATAEEALAALARFDGNARLLAGGQSLVPLLSMRLLRPTAVIDINGIPGLDRIEAGHGVVRVGALARYSALEASAVIRERVPLLAMAVPFVGDRQIRNRGTLGGALCHADPAGEMPLCAVTLGARLCIVGRTGRHRLRPQDRRLPRGHHRRPRRHRYAAPGEVDRGPHGILPRRRPRARGRARADLGGRR